MITELIIGYQKKILQSTTTKTVVEYRFIPRSIYDQQMSPENLENTFSDMFEKEDVFMRID